MKIAIIGAGISGIGAAYLLSPHHDVTMFEQNDYLGGHSRTVNVKTPGGDTPVDTGFIVFNDWNYPNILGFFNALNVPYHKSDMSFGVSINNGWLEYSSNNLFAQSKNIYRWPFLMMLKDVVTFNKKALSYSAKYPHATLQQCLTDLGMGAWFTHYYILAMGASIWSCPIEKMLEFPAATFLTFFKNHGLLNLIKRPQWYSVTGGSREYVTRAQQHINANIITEQAITAINIPHDTQKDTMIQVTTNDNQHQYFDHVILCCHADEALKLITAPSHDEQRILSAFDYQPNHIVVHHDEAFMPHNKKCWSSWSYISNKQTLNANNVCLSYWMNNLQQLQTESPLFVTLNPTIMPAKHTILDQHYFNHPIFDVKAVNAQRDIDTIQGVRGLWFCGAYQRYGFHEDGLLSAVNVAKKIGVSIPWQ